MSALMDLINKKKAALSSSKRAKTVKPQDGRSRWRILPTWRKDPNEQFWHDFGQHFIKDASGEIKAVYVCVDKTFGKPCEVCSSIQHAVRNSEDDTMVALLKEAQASGRVLVNALQIDGEDPSTPQILELSPGTFAEVLNIIQEWGAEVIDLKDGKDIVIERSGKGKLTKYSVNIGAKSAPVNPDVMKKVTNLDEYVAQESEDQAKRALANLSAIAGLLPAPGSKPKPTTTSALTDLPLDLDEDATLEIPGEPKSKTATVSAPAAADTTGDDELDNLLAELG